MEKFTVLGGGGVWGFTRNNGLAFAEGSKAPLVDLLALLNRPSTYPCV